MGKLAHQAGVSVRALRSYEEQGLLTSTCTAGWQRDDHDDAVERVVFFQQLYTAGLSSRRIAELLPCVDSGTTAIEQRHMLDHERDRITERISELMTARNRLDELISATENRAGSHPDCS